MSESGKVVHALGDLPYDVYVGRAMPRLGLKDEGWGNPYRPGYDGDLETVLEKFERRMRAMLYDDVTARQWARTPWPDRRAFRSALEGLRGKTLACFCAPKDEPLTLEDPVVCHAQTLLKLAEELANG